jgi:hypothetical protein
MVEIPALEESEETHHSSSVSRTDSGEAGDASPGSDFVVATKKKKKKKKKASSENFDS